MENEYKGYAIERHPNYMTYNVRSIGKGALPKELQGAFTSIKFLKDAVDRYVDKKAAA